MQDDKKVGLALSGGGYRAAAFHLGTLKKLDELGVLEKVDNLSCVSGGSIVGAYYVLNKHLPFSQVEIQFKKCLQRNVIKQAVFSFRFILFAICLLLTIGLIVYLDYIDKGLYSTLLLILSIIVFLRYQFKLLPLNIIIDKVYRNIFYGDKTLKDLHNAPLIAINNTNVTTGTPWTFSQRKMGDSTYDYSYSPAIKFIHESFPISMAVTGSSCVPFGFSPIRIDKTYYANENDYNRIRPLLVDGGVYDNQGAHKLMQANSSYFSQTVIVSDAGQPWKENSSWKNNFSLLIRTSNIFMRRIKTLQFVQNIYHSSNKKTEEVAYLALDWDITKCISGFIDNLKKDNISDSLLKHHGIIKGDTDYTAIQKVLETNIGYADLLTQRLTEDQHAIAKSVSTNLTSLSENEINYLMAHAALLTEIQVRLYCPSLLGTN